MTSKLSRRGPEDQSPVTAKIDLKSHQKDCGNVNECLFRNTLITMFTGTCNQSGIRISATAQIEIHRRGGSLISYPTHTDLAAQRAHMSAERELPGDWKSGSGRFRFHDALGMGMQNRHRTRNQQHRQVVRFRTKIRFAAEQLDGCSIVFRVSRKART